MVSLEWTPKEIRALREATRQSPLEFARAVGVTKRTLQLWESGETSSVREASKRLLYGVLESASNDVQQRFWSGLARLSAPESSTQSTDVDVLFDTADESAALLPWAETTNVGPLTIKDLRSNLQLVTREYLKSPTLPLFRRVVEARNRAVELLQGRQRPQQSIELYGIAGWSMTILGWMTTDLGRPDIADRHLRAAWALADNADDNELRGWICAARNTAAAWRGDYQDAADAAIEGLQLAGAGTAVLILSSAAAIDLARLGRIADSNSALQQARDVAAQFVDEPQRDTFAGPFSCSLERAEGYWAETALVNGDATRSVEFATAAIELFEDAGPVLRNLGSERMVRCQLIKAHIVLGDLDIALTQLGEVANATPVEHRVGPLVQRVDEIAQLARSTAGSAPGAVQIGESAADFRRRADLDGLPALAAATNGD
ncbi:helix-turn-helix domain-containing protein [Nocardia terpenica]|uniref:helix-turn-helix domain-containing protein n=1 Tax=Nocardia terpenica TaxID=455432 RepID=UPI0012FD18C1|nr:hypothetical protein [Nocardia terpenica]